VSRFCQILEASRDISVWHTYFGIRQSMASMWNILWDVWNLGWVSRYTLPCNKIQSTQNSNHCLYYCCTQQIGTSGWIKEDPTLVGVGVYSRVGKRGGVYQETCSWPSKNFLYRSGSWSQLWHPKTLIKGAQPKTRHRINCWRTLAFKHLKNCCNT